MALARPWTAAALAITAVAASGCRTQVTQGPADHARGTARAFLADCARGDVIDAVDLLTPAARATFMGDGAGRTACMRFLGFDRPKKDLSPAEREDVLRKTSVRSIHGIRTDQFSSVSLTAPDGRRSDLDVERRAELWLLSRPAAADDLGTAHPEEDARGTAGSFVDLCAKGEYGSAEELLTVAGRQDFDANGADAHACLKVLGLSKPKEDLSPDERRTLLEKTKIADISDVHPMSATVTVTAPKHGKAKVEAENHGSVWELTKPSGTPKDAVASLLDSCAHEQYETAKDLMATAARTRFTEHGADLDACLEILGLRDELSGSETEREEALDEAKVSDVKTTGDDAATVTMDVPDHGHHDVPTERHGDSWDVAAAD